MMLMELSLQFLQSLNDSLGGVASVADALNSHLETGISDNSEEISQRKMVQFSQNWAQAHNYLHFLKKPCKLWCMVLLFLAGVMSLVFGIKEKGLQSGWVDGAIVFGTLVALLVTSIRDWFEARTAMKKSQKEQILQEVGVVRGGKKVQIDVSYLDCGDLVCLEAGYLVPADGLFVSGEGLEIDDDGTVSICNQQNPFLFYGSRVVKGSAKMLVISEGVDGTVLGEMMKEALESTQEKTKTETKIDKLSEIKNIVGLILSILLLLVVFLRFLGGKIDDDSGNRPDSKGPPTELERILHYLKIIFTESKGNSRVLSVLIGVSLVGLMEGMPFVVAIAIRHWNSKTLSDRASDKDESSCVRMAEVTTICIENNVGWLKENRIEVGEVVFVNLDSDVSKAILRDGIGTSSSAIDQPLLSWAEKAIGLQREASNKCCTIVDNNGEVNPFKKPCGVVVERITDSGKEFDVHFKGPAHSILDMCSFYYDNTGKMEAINEEKKQQFAETMKGMQGKHLEVIAYASKSNTGVQKFQGEGLTFLGMFGLKHTETRDRPIASLLASGIKLVLFSQNHDVSELKQLIISREIGISETDAADRVLTLTGDELQQCPDEEMFEKLGSITVVGKCNSKLKQRIVRCLRSKGEVVAVVGERSGDAPIMKEADIGLAIKSEYSEITTQSANVIIMKGSFSLLIDMIICGRNIYENLQKFIQVDMIMTIANSLINLISAVSSGDTPLSPIQLFWIYFLISIPGGLALLSAQPNKNLQDTTRPIGPLITKAMWVNILLQSFYQTAIFVTLLQLKGTAILGISQKADESMIFNAFVFCQLVNIFTSRGLKELNIFKSFGQNPWFWVGSVAFVVIHLPFDAVYGFIEGGTGWNWKQWLGCCLIWAVSWLMDLIAKFQITEIAKHWAQELGSTSDWLIRIMRRSTSMNLNASAPSESMSNLQNPLMAAGSTANTVQSNSSG